MNTPSSWRTALRGQRLWLAIGLVVTGLILALWWLRPASTDYQTVEVVRGDIEASVNALGTLQPQMAVDVGAQVLSVSV